MSLSCQDCGACCVSFRVSFYWAESDAHPDGTVPQHLTIPISPHHVAMRGTECKPVRCIALEGEVGQFVSCSIYPLRASSCRQFNPDDPRCNEIRQKFGLPPIPPEQIT